MSFMLPWELTSIRPPGMCECWPPTVGEERAALGREEGANYSQTAVPVKSKFNSDSTHTSFIARRQPRSQVPALAGCMKVKRRKCNLGTRLVKCNV